MRRLTGAILCGLLVACTQTPAEPPPDVIASAAPTVASPTSIEPAVSSPLASPTGRCRGRVGRAPSDGEITFLSREDEYDLLYRADPSSGETWCIAAFNRGRVDWGPQGDRVLVGGAILTTNPTQIVPDWDDREAATATWSRPTGKSIIYVREDGGLAKISWLADERQDISFLEDHQEVTYHPAGTHVAVVGTSRDGTYGIWFATNIGTEPKLLARGEEAKFIAHLEFSQDGRWLYYSARHGPRDWHLHRLSIGQGEGLKTIATSHADFEIAVSPFEPDQHAYSTAPDCDAGDEHGPFALSGMKVEMPPDIRLSHIQPIGFLPGRRLVVKASKPCESEEVGDIYILSRRAPVLVAEDHQGPVALRVRMPPPPLPPGEEQEVVA